MKMCIVYCEWERYTTKVEHLYDHSTAGTANGWIWTEVAMSIKGLQHNSTQSAVKIFRLFNEKYLSTFLAFHFAGFSVN